MKQRIISNTNPEWPNFEIEFDKPILFFNDYFNESELDHISENYFKILYLREAEAINPMRDKVIRNYKKFNVILTFDDIVLKTCPNSFMLLFGSAWVHNYNFVPKEFSASHITGHKMMAPGHKLRQQINANQDIITIPKNFYVSKHGYLNNMHNNPILGDGKEPLFKSQFHICIENSQQINYFTEKIMDCFVTKTIPIYWGCPNIGDFFDTSGMFIVSSFDDIIKICNSLNETTYERVLDAANKNYLTAQKYIDITKNLENELNDILKSSDFVTVYNA